jgi:hypothetical protein
VVLLFKQANFENIGEYIRIFNGGAATKKDRKKEYGCEFFVHEFDS